MLGDPHIQKLKVTGIKWLSLFRRQIFPSHFTCTGNEICDFNLLEATI